MPARHVFISYSHQDKPFVERLEQRIQQEGIDIWRDEKAATSGRLERQINDAIFQKDALLLVFSQHSCGSDWVEWEALQRVSPFQRVAPSFRPRGPYSDLNGRFRPPRTEAADFCKLLIP